MNKIAARKYQFGLKAFFVFLVVVSCSIWLMLLASNWMNRESERALVADEGRWLARHIGEANGDFDLALKSVHTDPPPIGTKFVEKWRSNIVKPRFGNSVIAYRDETTDGETLVILEDLSIDWQR